MQYDKLMVQEFNIYTSQDIAELDVLMHEFSATSFCNKEILLNALNDTNVHVYVIRDEGQIVATGTLCIKHTLLWQNHRLRVTLKTKC